MKKSKVLVPAMALLLFSTAASITGTVAWFSSTRVFDTSTGDFEVAKLDGNLACTITPLIGTSVSGTAVNLAPTSPATKLVLGDASFDHTQKKLYTDTDQAGTYELLDTMAAADPAKNGFVAGSNAAKWKYSTVGTTDYYYAVAWNLQFSYNFVAEKKGMNVFFSINDSTMTPETPTGTTAHDSGNDTAKGFRIAFLSQNKAKVWAKLCDHKSREYDSSASSWKDAADYTPTYVNSENTATGAYSGDFIDASSNLARATDSTPSQTSRLDYLGTIALNEGQTETLTVTCVAWYEGTDPNVVNESTMRKVRTSMHFYACQANA
jgi:hypothetical protein